MGLFTYARNLTRVSRLGKVLNYTPAYRFYVSPLMQPSANTLLINSPSFASLLASEGFEMCMQEMDEEEADGIPNRKKTE